MKKFNLINNIPSEKGTYILCLSLPIDKKITIGKLGTLDFKKGYYIYVGSAFNPGGLKARINRHLNKKSSTFWHIDYLKKNCDIINVGFILNKKFECLLARNLAKKFYFIKNFGCSDCKCLSHLFWNDDIDKFFKFFKRGDLPLYFIWHQLLSSLALSLLSLEFQLLKHLYLNEP